jgi:hypothetical protein
MENVKLIFTGTERSKTSAHEMECYCNYHKEIYIDIYDGGDYTSHICLSKETAVRLSKELKKQIALING